MVTGDVSGITVLDVDPRSGGIESLQKLGVEDGKYPTVRTGSGGLHLYFSYCPELNTSTARLPGIDIRGEGGLVVVPPSTHPSGNPYMWVSPAPVSNSELPDIPDNILEALNATSSSPRNYYLRSDAIRRDYKPFDRLEETLAGVKEGGRNEACARLAGRYLGKGLTVDEVTMILVMWNERNSPPLDEEEIERTVKSIWRTHCQNGK